MDKIRVGIIGLGFIGMQHLDALHRVPGVEITAVCDSREGVAKDVAERWGIGKAYTDWRQLTDDPEIDAVHNCTPNSLHDMINERTILNGKHIYCEKPLSDSTAEARRLWKLAEVRGVAHGVNHQYRMNAAVQEMQTRLLNGEAGRPLLVCGHYMQESASRDTDYTVKMENTGIARVVNDIGIHFIDTVCCAMNSPVTAVMAELTTHFPIRTDALGNKHAMDTEDSAVILLRFGNGVTGTLTTTKVANGHKNDLAVQILCDGCSLEWQQESPDRLVIGEKGVGRRELYMSPQLVHDEVKPWVTTPAGHTMGWPDALRNALVAYYGSIRDGSWREKEQVYCTFRDGVLGTAFIEACVRSSELKQWVEVEQP